MTGPWRAARCAAQRGLPVFPLLPGGKTPLIRAAHPVGHPCGGGCGRWGHGYRDASTDLDVIAVWERRWPRANYGIATGAAGRVVIDLDAGKGTPPAGGPHPGGAGAAVGAGVGVLADQGEDVTPGWIRDGAGVLAWMAERDGADLADALDTFTVATPSGGRHLYYLAPVPSPGSGPARAQSLVRSSVGFSAGRVTGLGWCIDVRAAGGYVVGPGSLAAGGAYTVVGPGPVRALPGFLATRITAIGTHPAASAGLRPPAARRPGPAGPGGAGSGGARAGRFWQAALAGELAHIAAARAGAKDGTGRNATVNRAAYKLGRLVDAYLDEDGLADVVEQLVTAATATGLGEREARASIASGLAAGRARPRTPAARGGGRMP